MIKYEDTLQKYFGFDKFRNNQLDIIKAIIEDKKDVLVCMATGSGKSICFQFPPVYTNKVCLVVSPLISLMNDQKIKMNNIDIPTCCLNGTVYNKNELKNEILENNYRLVYITPEYLITQEDFLQELYDKDILVLIAIDEAHCISSYGHEFRESYKRLNCLREWIPDVPIIGLSATITKPVENDIKKTLKMQNALIIKASFDRPNLLIKILPKSSKAENDILSMVKEDEPTIIYCQTRNSADKIAEKLTKKKYISKSYHAGMNSSDRNDVHEEFSSGKLNCVVATVAFGMGIDATVRKVIHYGIPKDMESYYQEIGRAGRDGKRSECIMFYALSDMNNNNYFINQIKNIQYRNHMMQLTLAMKNYIFSSECRRKYILAYFGEKYTKDNCGLCDNCLNIKKTITFNFAKDARLLFDTINLTGNAYGGTMIINILRGAKSKKIQGRNKKSDLYGSGAHHTEKWWKIFLRIVINNGYLREKPIAGGHGFILSNTPKSLEWLTSYKLKKDITLILPVPEDMQNLLPKKTKPALMIDTDVDDIELITKIDDMLEEVYPKKQQVMIDKLETTYDLYQNKKKTINQIAAELNLSTRTIEEHLIKLYDKNYELDLHELKFNDEIYNIISKKIIELGPQSQLSVIKQNLPHNISYMQIKLTLVRMEKDKIIKKDQEEYIVVKSKKSKNGKNNKNNKIIKKINIEEIMTDINNKNYIIQNKNIDTEYKKIMEKIMEKYK